MKTADGQQDDRAENNDACCQKSSSKTSHADVYICMIAVRCNLLYLFAAAGRCSGLATPNNTRYTRHRRARSSGCCAAAPLCIPVQTKAFFHSFKWVLQLLLLLHRVHQPALPLWGVLSLENFCDSLELLSIPVQTKAFFHSPLELLCTPSPQLTGRVTGDVVVDGLP